MKRGALPTKRQPRRQIHSHLGVVGTPLPTNDFCLDTNLWWPNQEIDQAPTECVGYSVADIFTDKTGLIMDPDWVYMLALLLNGQPAGCLDGTDPTSGMDVPVAFGALQERDADFYASNKGEAFCATPSNWDNRLESKALTQTSSGIASALGSGDPFTSIITAARYYNLSVSCGTIWPVEFEHPNSDGTVTWTYSPQEFVGGHNWVAKGMKTLNGKPYLMCKSHQGRAFGDGGWLYLDQTTINSLFSIPGSVAISPIFDTNRLVSMCGIIIKDFPGMIPRLKAILQANLSGMV